MSERFDKFTESARRTLQLAQEESRRLNHNYIGSEHLLLGLVGEGRSPAAQWLASAGVDLAKARSAVESKAGRQESAPSGDIALTPHAMRAIEHAVEEARELKHDYIASEHLAFGLAREGEGVAVVVLESLGVSPDQMRDEMLRLLSQPAEPRVRVAGSRPVSTADPWQVFQADVMYGDVEAALTELESLTEEIAYRRLASGPGYECGVVRFLPRDGSPDRFVVHQDKDVLCHVLRGKGQLRVMSGERDLTVGEICRIPAGAAHDFVASGEPLVLLYVSILVRGTRP